MWDIAGHILAIVFTGIAAAASLYVSNKLLKNKSETLAEAKEMFPSKDSFEAHERQDAQRFQQMQEAAETRHAELREDISKVSGRVDK